MQTIFVDDGSESTNPNAYQADVVLLNHSRFGTVEAYNIGLRYATGNKVITSTNDSFISGDIVLKMGEVLNARPDIGMIAPLWVDLPFYEKEDKDLGYIKVPVRLWDPVLYGGAQMFRNAELKLIGFYDRLLYNNWDDHDMTRTYLSFQKKVVVLRNLRGESIASKATPISYTRSQKIRFLLSRFYGVCKWGYEVDENILRNTVLYHYLGDKSITSNYL